MKLITSFENPKLKAIRKLQRKKTRDHGNVYLIEGLNLTREALAAKEKLKITLVRESLVRNKNIKQSDELEELLKLLKITGVDIYVVSDDVFDRTANTETPQGLLSVVSKKKYETDTFFSGAYRQSCSNIIILDRLQDPGNVGTIIRTADAADFLGAIILKGTVDVYAPKVVRAATGSLFRLPFLFIDSPLDAINLLHKYNKRIIATTPYCKEYYFEHEMSHDIGLVIGNEGSGICSVFLDLADVKIRIPMKNSVESLNVAVSAGIMMYETIRGKYKKKDGGR